MRERPVPRLSRLPSMGSQQRLPWPSVCGSLELTARSRRSSSSAWILPSRGSVCPFSHPCFRWSTLLTDKIDILFSFPFFHPLLPSSRQQVKETCFSFFCLLASISLRIPWVVLVRTFLSWALEVEINGEWPWQRLRFHRNESPDPNQL